MSDHATNAIWCGVEKWASKLFDRDLVQPGDHTIRACLIASLSRTKLRVHNELVLSVAPTSTQQSRTAPKAEHVLATLISVCAKSTWEKVRDALINQLEPSEKDIAQAKLILTAASVQEEKTKRGNCTIAIHDA